MKPITISSIPPKIAVTPGSITITMSPVEALLFHSLLGRVVGGNFKSWLALGSVLNEHGSSTAICEKAAELVRNSYTGKSRGIPLDDLVQAMESNLRNHLQGVSA